MKNKVAILIVFVILSGCDSGSPTSTRAFTPVPDVSVSTPTKVASETATITPSSTLVNQPTETLTSLPESKPLVKYKCPSVVTEVPAGIDIQGLALLEPISFSENPYLLNFLDGGKTALPYSEDFSLEEMRVSPDRKWVAYFASPIGEISPEILLVVANPEEEILYEKAVNKDEWFAIDTWLNAQTILLERYQLVPDLGILDSPLPVSILNPFSGESVDLSSDFPDLLPFFEPLASWDVFGKSGTAYDPTLNYVAYAMLNPVDRLENIVLWDVRNGQEIANIQAAEVYGNGPVWSPDGSQFITDSLARIPDGPRGPGYETIPEELFSVSLNGEITRLTYFADQFQKASVGGYVWSPEGRQVAFWVFTEPAVEEFEPTGSEDYLAILDLQDRSLTLYCVDGVQYLEPSWSPTGQQILVSAKNADKTNQSGTLVFDVFLIDLSQNMIIKIADETVALGWMVYP